jgi:hypothetical protein
MLAMYADESGKRDEHEYVLISGYLGLVAQWEEFCEAWRIRVAKDGLPEFHANQFFNAAVSSRGGRPRNENLAVSASSKTSLK